MRRPRGKQPHFGDILPGRPTPTADLPLPTGKRDIEKLYAEYFEAIDQLTYTEGMRLVRGLGYGRGCWLARKYRHRKPRLPEVVLTLNWIRNGKPTIANKRRLTAELLFGKPL